MKGVFLAIGVIYALLTLAYLLAGQALISLDMAISQSVFYSLLPYVAIFNLVTNIGSAVFLLILAVWLIRRGDKKVGILLLIGIVVDMAINLLAKVSFGRERPPYFSDELWSLEPSGSLSFPSGHAERAFMAATVLSSFFSKDRILLYIFAGIIGFTRIAVGAHYILDVVVGSLNGIVIGYMIIRFPWERYIRFTQRQAQPSARTRKR